jgi:hypothetical protein
MASLAAVLFLILRYCAVWDVTGAVATLRALLSFGFHPM